VNAVIPHLKRWVSLLGVALLFVITMMAHAETALNPLESKRLGWMEEALFAASYTEEAPETRLKRLEDEVLGKTFPGESAEHRVERLHEALMARKQSVSLPVVKPTTTASRTAASGKKSNLTPKAPPPLMKETRATTPKDPESQQHALSKPQSTPQANTLSPNDVESDYPVVDAMEQKVFGRAFSNEPLGQRLDRLDQQIFGAPQGNPYAARVDNLKTLVLGNRDIGYGGQLNDANRTPPAHQDFPGIPPRQNPLSPWGQAANQPNTTGLSQPSPSATAGENLPTVTDFDPIDNDLNPGQRADMERALAQVEKKVLSATYENEPVESRLARLEERIFKQTAPPGTTNQDRLDRLIAVAAADSSEVKPVSTKRQILQTVIPFIPIILLMLL